MDEIWKPINGFNGQYEVSNFGEVRSLPRNGTVLKPRLIMGFIDKGGYHQVLLSGGRVHKKIHRLVAEAFIPNPEDKPCVNHIDRVRTNNRVENLEWCTHLENVQHTFRCGYKAQEMNEHSQSKLDEMQVFCILKSINDGSSIKGVSRYFKVTEGTIRDILSGKHWMYRKYMLPSYGHYISSRTTPVVFIDKNGSLINFESIQKASDSIGVSPASICNNISGLTKNTRKGRFMTLRYIIC